MFENFEERLSKQKTKSFKLKIVFSPTQKQSQQSSTKAMDLWQDLSKNKRLFLHRNA